VVVQRPTMEGPAVSAGRDAEFTEYVSARLPSLRRLAMLLCQDWQRADDLVQAAITKLYVHWGRARRADHVDAYARAVLVHEFVHERRSGWARRVSLTGTVTEPAAAAVDHDAVLDLRTALAALPARQRATVVLRFYCDLNVDQSAELLGCSAGTVKSQTAKALGTLRRALEPLPATGPGGRPAAERSRHSREGDA
jgi:RNA polymerase sigma-70 factor (sigma-E family)